MSLTCPSGIPLASIILTIGGLHNQLIKIAAVLNPVKPAIMVHDENKFNMSERKRIYLCLAH